MTRLITAIGMVFLASATVASAQQPDPLCRLSPLGAIICPPGPPPVSPPIDGSERPPVVVPPPDRPRVPYVPPPPWTEAEPLLCSGVVYQRTSDPATLQTLMYEAQVQFTALPPGDPRQREAFNRYTCYNALLNRERERAQRLWQQPMR